MLDYGCGTGQVTMAFQHCHYFDIAEDSRSRLKKSGRTVYGTIDEIPRGRFDWILSSHALEHSPRPLEDLLRFGDYAKSDGHLLLIRPIETRLRRALQPDGDNHLYCWTFQTISNLLREAGWKPLFQDHIYDSFGLGALSRILGNQAAVQWSWRLGRLRGGFKSMFIVAAKQGPS